MAQTGVRLEIDPEIAGKLSAGSGLLWSAVHGDGSDNRINGVAIADAASIDTSLGFIVAGFQWLKKAFRNRGKTREDLAAEAEAAKINRTCVALDVMLMEYIQAAREGSIDGEALDELIAALEEMQGYLRSGKLRILDEGTLAEAGRSIAAYTAAILGPDAEGPVRSDGTGFDPLLAQLTRQRKWLAEGAR